MKGSQEASANENASEPSPSELLVFLRRKATFSLPQSGTIRVGRSHSCDLRIDHHSVSRYHLALHVSERGIELEDLGSRNGTRIFPTGTTPHEESSDDTHTHNSEADFLVEPGKRSGVKRGDMLRVGSVLVRIQAPGLGESPSIIPAPRESEGDEVVVWDAKTSCVFELAQKCATSDIAILLLGETGVGKDVLARAIHRASPRAQGPFVRIHCATLSERLLENDLFGVHGDGASPDADRAGSIESAHGGTVFFDEIGELPPALQVKLLGVIETGQVKRVGASTPTQVDVRFIATTHHDLAHEVQAGRFRKDLYFRINGVSLTLDPLRERMGDLAPLARHFVKAYCERMRVPAPSISPEAIEHMRRHSWPGNVRELKNAIERALLSSDNETLLPEHLPLGETAESGHPTERPSDYPPEPHSTSSRDELGKITAALDQCGGNQTRAARVLGISRRTLVNRLNELGLPRPRKGSASA